MQEQMEYFSTKFLFRLVAPNYDFKSYLVFYIFMASIIECDAFSSNATHSMNGLLCGR